MSASGLPPEGARARILAIAADHIRRFGPERLSVVHVAREAGMTHANVYRYFASKAALAEEVATDWLRGIEQRLADITQAPDPAHDKLERFLTLLSRAYEDKARSEAAIFAAFAERGGAAGERHRQRVRQLLGRIVEEGLTTRVFAGSDGKRTETLVLDAMHRFIDPQAVLEDVPRDAARGGAADARRDRLVRLVVRGLASGRV